MTELIAVNDVERERIRAGLNRYKKENKKGDTLLLEDMKATLDLSEWPYLKFKALERFIKGTHRTSDEAVWRYKKFLERVAPPPAEDTLGSALSAYLSPFMFNQDWAQTLTGEYLTIVRRNQSDPYLKCAPIKDDLLAKIGTAIRPLSDEFEKAGSLLRLQPAIDPSFLRAGEFTPPDSDDDTGGTTAQPWLGRIGLITPFGDSDFLMLLRSYLQTQLFLLRKVGDHPLALHGTAFLPFSGVRFVSGQIGEPWQPAYEIILIKQHGSEALEPSP